MIGAGRPRPEAAAAIRQVSRARRYGEVITTSGSSSAGRAASHAPTAADCSSPSGVSGTSESRPLTSASSNPAAFAA